MKSGTALTVLAALPLLVQAWKEGSTVCLYFRLHGARDGSPECVQGQVTVP